MQSGLRGFDAVAGPLPPGAVCCVAGRPCVGKTSLLIDVALRVLQQQQTNVVFATAQQEAERILLRLPRGAMARFMPLPSIDRLFDAIEQFPEPEPHVYLLDVQDVGAVQAQCVAHRLKLASPAGCGLVVSDGWSVRPAAPTLIERVVDGHRYLLEWERPARRLRTADLAQARRDASASGIAMLYGVGTAAREDMDVGPQIDDLREIGALVRAGGIGAVLLHRPELYLGHDEGRREIEGLVTLCSVTGGREPRRSVLRYEPDERGFVDVARH